MATHPESTTAAVVAGDSADGGGDFDPWATFRPRFGRLTTSPEGIITGSETSALELLGYRAEALIGGRIVDHCHVDDQRTALTAWTTALARPGVASRCRLRHRCADDSFRWMEMTSEFDPHGAQGATVSIGLLDIDDEMAAVEALRERESLLHRLTQALPLGLVHADVNGRIVYVNDQLVEITGVRDATTLADQFASASVLDRDALIDVVDHIVAESATQQVEIRLGKGHERRVCDVRLSCLTLDDDTPTGVIICVSDITESATLRRELHTRATRDALTGCHNRESALTALEAHLVDPAPGLAVVFIDLDGFKEINDNLGHSAGDSVLVEVARRLQEAVRPDDIVGRFGGDEFIVISPGASTSDGASRLAERLGAELAFEMVHDRGSVSVDATLGPAWIDRPGTTADSLVALADGAMYERKRERKRLRRDHDTADGMPTGPAEGLLKAADRGELDLVYRGIVDIEAGRIVGAEAVLVWRRDGEVLDVASLVAEAETTGSIVPVGQWIIEQFVADVAAARDAGATRHRWFIKMSGRELAANGPDRLKTAADRHELSPSSVIVGIGHSHESALGSTAHVAALRLAELGFGVGLADFGSGWSSLGMVQNLPITWLHVAHAADSEPEALTADKLVESVQSLATAMGMNTIVDGVSSIEQLQRLRALEVPFAQGPLYGAPLGVHDVLALDVEPLMHAV